MKNFGEMTNDEIVAIINKSKLLRDKLDNYIQDCEMDYLSDKLSCVKKSLSDWSVGFYQPSYIEVRDCEDFVDGVLEHEKCFGLSDKCSRLARQCNKLRGTNLFEYYAEKLKDLYFKEEYEDVIDFVEDCGYELYQGEVGEKCYDYIECWVYNFEDWLYDEETETIYDPYKLDAA